MKQKILLSLFILYLCTGSAYSQSKSITLTLDDAIALAADSSLTAFRYKNMYRSSYWAYRSYRANRLPSLTLDLIPAQYYRNMTQRYDSESDMDIFREQQMFSASGGIVTTAECRFPWRYIVCQYRVGLPLQFRRHTLFAVLLHPFPNRLFAKPPRLQCLSLGTQD